MHPGMGKGTEKWDEAPSMESWVWGSFPRPSRRPCPSRVAVTARLAAKRMPVVPASHAQVWGSSGMSPALGIHRPGFRRTGALGSDRSGSPVMLLKGRGSRPLGSPQVSSFLPGEQHGGQLACGRSTRQSLPRLRRRWECRASGRVFKLRRRTWQRRREGRKIGGGILKGGGILTPKHPRNKLNPKS